MSLEYLTEVVVFVVLAYLLYTKVWKTLLVPQIEARQQAIARELDESRAAHERLEQAEREYRAALAGVAEEAARMRAEAQVEARQIVEDLRREAEEEYVRMVAVNEARLAAERQSVVFALRQEIGQLTFDIAERMVRESLADEERQRRVVDRFLADLDTGGPIDSRDLGAQPAGRGVGEQAGRSS
jgi:F-type H+-transporting ATPase subunit b